MAELRNLILRKDIIRMSIYELCDLYVNCYKINKYKINFSVSNTQTWAEQSNRIVQKSQSERGHSAQMRSDVENLINTCAQEVSSFCFLLLFVVPL